MKKTRKRALGLLGLFAVGAMTMVAAGIPSPEVSAISTTADTIEVRVTGSTPAVELESAIDGKTVTSPNITLNIRYENASKLFLRRFYVDEGVYKESIEYDDLASSVGQINNVELTVDNYGEYKISAEAIGFDGVPSPEDYITFKYLPVIGTYETDPVTGGYCAKVDSASNEVHLVKFYVDGVLVATQYRAQFEKSECVPLNLNEKGIYKITLVADNAGGESLYIPYAMTIDYNPGVVPDAGTPDTGSFFKNLNISSEDYLTTGLIAFFVLSVVAIGIVLSGCKGHSKKRR